jgi:hypothetical protein
MKKLKLYLFVVLVLSCNATIGQYKTKVAKDSLMERVLIIKSAELVRAGNHSLEDHFCFSQNTDSIYVKQFTIPYYSRYVFYKVSWEFEAPAKCFLIFKNDTNYDSVTKTSFMFHYVLIAVQSKENYQFKRRPKIFRLKGFENDDIDELLLDMEKNYYSKPERKKLLKQIKNIEGNFQ